MDKYFVQVLLPLRLEWIPTYSSEQKLKRGQAVNVRFANRSYIGIVWNTDLEQPSTFKVKPIISTATAIPDISEEEMQMWEFTASYYMCSLGELYKSLGAKRNLDKDLARSRRLERLEARYAKLQEQLARKHRSAIVVERLQCEASKLKELIEQLQAPASTTAITRRNQRTKPLLLIANQRVNFYISKLRSAISKGAQALILAPTIAHFALLEERLREEFGELLLIYNSHRSPSQRQEVTDCLRNKECAVVLGTRSAVFLPFANLSLIIVDSEQDAFYKQSLNSPRYNGRDLALFLSYLHGSETILGSSAPSLESLYNSQLGKYSSLRLDDASYCSCEIVDIASEKRKRGMIACLSRKLIDAAARFAGPIYMLRAWEDAAEVNSACAQLLPNKEVKVLTINEFLNEAPAKGSLLAVLGADAYLSRDDFRSDERAIQLLASLRALCARLIVQTNVPQRFDPSNKLEDLMEERRQFGYPPFKRIVDVRSSKDHILLRQHFLERDSSLAFRKAQIMNQLQDGEYLDVDPDYAAF